MRLIDADELKIDYGFTWDDITPTHEEMYAIIDRQTTIDAVEVVRCKDCAKREYCRTSTVWAVAPNDDWYCADAERKIDE